jgi:hypothetical protein
MQTCIGSGVYAEWNGRYQRLTVGKKQVMPSFIVLTPECVKALGEWQAVCDNAKSWKFAPACETIESVGFDDQTSHVDQPSQNSHPALNESVDVPKSFSRVQRLNRTG